jgi:hypothetical protein
MNLISTFNFSNDWFVVTKVGHMFAIQFYLSISKKQQKNNNNNNKIIIIVMIVIIIIIIIHWVCLFILPSDIVSI